ncbi:putative protein OS=Streptomyces glaucescens OX=1907 GN=SGLAU_04560 PE=4 SV=1 [Streptomyces glaucescens]
MSAVHETAVELTTVVQHLEKLAWELRDSSLAPHPGGGQRGL